jgi:hypothetical protein
MPAHSLIGKRLKTNRQDAKTAKAGTKEIKNPIGSARTSDTN